MLVKICHGIPVFNIPTELYEPGEQENKFRHHLLVDAFKEAFIQCESFLFVSKKPKTYQYLSAIILEDSGKQIIAYTQTRPTWSFIFPQYDTQQFVFYYVQFSPALGMNVTFYKVHFPVTTARWCDQARMLVCKDQRFWWEVDKMRNVMIRQLNYFDELVYPGDERYCHKFCGIYSKGNIYPHGRRLQLLFHGGSTSFVDLFFSVIDQNRINTFFPHFFSYNQKLLHPE